MTTTAASVPMQGGQSAFLAKWRGSSALLPALIFLLILFIVPLVLLLPVSVSEKLGIFHSYWNLLQDSTFLKIIANTFITAFWVTGFGLLLGFPVAWGLCVLNKTVSQIALAIIIMSMWTSLLARTYSWMILRQSNGPINNLLSALHLISHPLPLVDNEVGVVIGMVYIMLPFMVMPIYGGIQKMDASILNAAAICGAGRFSIFYRIFIPLLRGPIAAASLMVFVMSLGYYVTPALLGAPKNMMLAQLIAEKVQNELNWQYATASAVLLLGMTLVLYWVVYVRASGELDADS